MMKHQIIASDQETKDFFEDLRSQVGCMNISDMRYMPHIMTAKRLIQKFCFEDYPLKQLNDMAEYLYGEEVFFNYPQQAEQFFLSRMGKAEAP